MASTQGYKRVRVDLQNFRKNLRNLNKDPVAKMAVNQAFADRCDKYVPAKSGRLANVSISLSGVTYRAPYAHYQYTGEVYGPNYYVPIELKYIDEKGNKHYDPNGEWGFRSPEGEEKEPTGAKLEYNTGSFWEYEVFHPLATSHWDKAMLANEKSEFYKDCKNILTTVFAKRERIRTARASVW